MFPPIELANDCISHYEAIRLQQPDSIMMIICLPRLKTPGSDYKHLEKNTSVFILTPPGLIYFQG